MIAVPDDRSLIDYDLPGTAFVTASDWAAGKSAADTDGGLTVRTREVGAGVDVDVADTSAVDLDPEVFDTQLGRRRRKTVLEQHCAFFDRDQDGVIWPSDSYRTCRDFGWNVAWSLFFAAFLHVVQSWGTVNNRFGLPDPLLRIWVENVRFNKHGSSTMAFDNDGVFRPAMLDDFFAKYDTDGKGGLTFGEGWRALRGIRMVWDAFGQVSAAFEWGFTYVLLWPEDGIVRKEDARRVLDGSIFHDKMTRRPQDRRRQK